MATKKATTKKKTATKTASKSKAPTKAEIENNLKAKEQEVSKLENKLTTLESKLATEKKRAESATMVVAERDTLINDLSTDLKSTIEAKEELEHIVNTKMIPIDDVFKQAIIDRLKDWYNDLTFKQQTIFQGVLLLVNALAFLGIYFGVIQGDEIILPDSSLDQGITAVVTALFGVIGWLIQRINIFRNFENAGTKNLKTRVAQKG
jgi:molecular chaperone GrpE (heat shock protein)